MKCQLYLGCLGVPHVLRTIRSLVHNIHRYRYIMYDTHTDSISCLSTHLCRHVLFIYIYTHSNIISTQVRSPTQEDWMLWFHAAVVWFVVLISAWQKLGHGSAGFFLSDVM